MVKVTAPCRGVLHNEGHLSQMVDLAAAAADPTAGSFAVPAGQRQARIRFGPEPSPLKRWDPSLYLALCFSGVCILQWCGRCCPCIHAYAMVHSAGARVQHCMHARMHDWTCLW